MSDEPYLTSREAALDLVKFANHMKRRFSATIVKQDAEGNTTRVFRFSWLWLAFQVHDDHECEWVELLTDMATDSDIPFDYFDASIVIQAIKESLEDEES